MWKPGKKKNEKVQPSASRLCGSCGMPADDPFWKICPRCRAELSDCAGCRACGKCAK